MRVHYKSVADDLKILDEEDLELQFQHPVYRDFKSLLRGQLPPIDLEDIENQIIIIEGNFGNLKGKIGFGAKYYIKDRDDVMFKILYKLFTIMYGQENIIMEYPWIKQIDYKISLCHKNELTEG